MIVFALLLTLIADSLSGAPPAPALSSSSSRSAPAFVVHRQPAVPIISLRLSLLASDPPGHAGAGHMIQHLLYGPLRERAGLVGAHLQIERTPDAVTYQLTGPASELGYLAELLRSTLSPPEAPLDAIMRAERELREERLAEWETAPAHARSLLRAQLFPRDISAAGTDRSATRFTAASLPRIWGQMYRPERVAIVAVGDLYLGDVQRAFGELPAASGTPPLAIEQDSLVLGSLAPAQATRGWFGAGYLANDLDPATLSIIARLLQEKIARNAPAAQVEAEHWWTHHGQALVLLTAAPEREIAPTRRALDTAVASLFADVDARAVARAATAIRRDMLFYARTPERMAEVIGRFVERDGDPNATELFFARLAGVELDEVRAGLELLLERTPARVALMPQPLGPRLR